MLAGILGTFSFLLRSIALGSERRVGDALTAEMHPTAIVERPGAAPWRQRNRPRRYRFADTGDVVWLTTAGRHVGAGDEVHATDATNGRRAVVWPDRDRPVLMWRVEEPSDSAQERGAPPGASTR